ncbi:hypothetical protein DSO57_1037445 [Entomophthora muscae]|uniref:Uncharacterized protein n=1 Tax=Entomophthora muscae TaxID=34485 RepID=A0ACC2SYZ2_9FUNG|nr:hypothetical protein DSO57_1037445 [Entomophthora muscae]
MLLTSAIQTLMLHSRDPVRRSTKGMDPKENILKAYITFVLPSAALATIGVILYLK